MTTPYILTVLATVASLSISIFGLPTQIWKNFKRKNTHGISLTLIVCSFISYTLWSIRAYVIGDYPMVLAYTPGSIFSVIILSQMCLYRKKIINKRDPRFRVKKMMAREFIYTKEEVREARNSSIIMVFMLVAFFSFIAFELYVMEHEGEGRFNYSMETNSHFSSTHKSVNWKF